MVPVLQIPNPLAKSPDKPLVVRTIKHPTSKNRDDCLEKLPSACVMVPKSDAIKNIANLLTAAKPEDKYLAPSTKPTLDKSKHVSPKFSERNNSDADSEKLSDNTADDIHSLNRWLSSNMKEKPARYLTESECETIRDSLETCEIEDVSVALLTCKQLAKVYLIDLLESCAETFDDTLDNWEERLEAYYLDLPKTLTTFLSNNAAKCEDSYEDILEYVREMPTLLVNFCVGAMVKNVTQITKDVAKDILQRLTLIGHLLFCSSLKPQTASPEKKKQDKKVEKSPVNVTDDVIEIDCDDDDDLHEDDVQDDVQFIDQKEANVVESDVNDYVAKFVEENVKFTKTGCNVSKRIAQEANHASDDVNTNTLKSSNVTKHKKTMLGNVSGVQISKKSEEDQACQKLLLEFSRHHNTDYRQVYLHVSISEGDKPVPSDRDCMGSAYTHKKSQNAGAECPFCLWKLTNTQDIDVMYKEFNEHIKSNHCNSNGKAFQETVDVFSSQQMWVDNLSLPELGQVFMCPYCLNVETSRSDHYLHVMRHENQTHHLTCFPCQKSFESYVKLLEHYSKKHGMKGIIPEEQIPKTQKWPATSPTIRECNDKPAQAEFTFSYFDVCLEMAEKHPGVLPFMSEGYPVFMAIQHAAKITFQKEYGHPTTIRKVPIKCSFGCRGQLTSWEEKQQHEIIQHPEAYICRFVLEHTADVNHWMNYKLGCLIRHCQFCELVTLGSARLKEHQKDKHIEEVRRMRRKKSRHENEGDENRHLCGTCGIACKTQKILDKHFCKPSSFWCSYCDSYFRTQQARGFHCLVMHPNKELLVVAEDSTAEKICPRCSKQFTGEGKDRLHSWHVAKINCMSDPNFVPQTVKCEKTFFACPRCNKRFFSPEKRDNHVAYVNCTNDPLFKKPTIKSLKLFNCIGRDKRRAGQCQKCGKMFHDLLNHNKKVNCMKYPTLKKQLNDSPKVYKERAGQCDRCGKMFRNLPEHKRKVNCTNDPTFEKPTKSSSKLSDSIPLPEKNMRKENSSAQSNLLNQNRAGQCDKCGKFLLNLHWHKQTVDCTGESCDWSCKKCGQKFTRVGTLRHAGKCPNDPPFKTPTGDHYSKDSVKHKRPCEKCGAMLGRDALKRHAVGLVNCTNDPNFVVDEDTKRKYYHECTKCKRMFTQARDLAQHYGIVNCTRDPNFVPDFSKGKKDRKGPAQVKIECPLCNKIVVQATLESHMRGEKCVKSYQIKQTIRCEKCGKTFFSRSSKRQHSATVNCTNDPNFVPNPDLKYIHGIQTNRQPVKKNVHVSGAKKETSVIEETEQAVEHIPSSVTVHASTVSQQNLNIHTADFFNRTGNEEIITTDEYSQPVDVVPEALTASSITIPQDSYIVQQTDEVTYSASQTRYVQADADTVLSVNQLQNPNQDLVIYMDDVPQDIVNFH